MGIAGNKAQSFGVRAGRRPRALIRTTPEKGGAGMVVRTVGPAPGPGRSGVRWLLVAAAIPVRRPFAGSHINGTPGTWHRAGTVLERGTCPPNHFNTPRLNLLYFNLLTFSLRATCVTIIHWDLIRSLDRSHLVLMSVE